MSIEEAFNKETNKELKLFHLNKLLENNTIIKIKILGLIDYYYIRKYKKHYQVSMNPFTLKYFFDVYNYIEKMKFISYYKNE